MADLSITKANSTDFSNIDYKDTSTYTDPTKFSDFYAVDSLNTDGASGINETEFTPDWATWHGYYRSVPEFSAVIDKLASWTIGKGYKSDKATEDKLKRIKGFGKDNFNSILKNTIRTALICGDSFSEIIRDKAGRLINLKPLNPGSMKIVVNDKGIVKRYEQVAQVAGVNKVVNKFDVKDIFHLSWNRIADEIHGIPFAEKVEEIIKMKMEGMKDLKVVFHRYVKPINIIYVDTDDEAEIAAFKSKWDNAYKSTENLILPNNTVSKVERVSVPQYSTLDPLPWLKYLSRVFVTTCGVPEVVMGWGEETTEASAKVIYLAFQQTIEDLQLCVELELKMQLGVEINLEFPASIEPEAETKEKSISSDEKKDGNKTKQMGVDPSKDQE